MERELIVQVGQIATRVAAATAVSIGLPEIQSNILQNINPLNQINLVRSASSMGIEPMPKLIVKESSRPTQANDFVSIKENTRWINLINEWRENRKNNGVEFTYEEADKLWRKANGYDLAPSILLMGTKLNLPQGEKVYSSEEKLPIKGVMIEKIGVSVALQEPISKDKNGNWTEPKRDLAWVVFDQKPYPYTIFDHRDEQFADIDQLSLGDTVKFSTDWNRKTEEIKTVVSKIEIVDASKQQEIIETSNSENMAIISCHPKTDPLAPQRMVVWLEVQE